jgi:sodium transport system permease protein
MIKTLFTKEFLDSIRDKRSVFAALLGAFLPPIMFAVMMTFVLEESTSVDELYITIENQQQAPHIVELLEQGKILHADMPEKGKDFELDGETVEHSKITITFEDSFAEKMHSGEKATITLLTDYSKKGARDEVWRVKNVINSYQSQLVAMKLVARGVSPSLLSAIHIEENDTSTPSSKSALLLGMLGVMIMVAVFVSSTNVAIDCSAGERERNSLELLIMQPVSTMQVVLAKTMNTAFFGIVGATLSVVFTAIAIPFIPLHKAGMAFNFDFQLGMTIWLLLVPLALFAAAFQLATAFHAKSFKEAQSYIQYTVMVPIIVPMMLEIVNYKNEVLSYIPIFAQQQAISQLIRGELDSYMPLLAGSVVTVITSLVIIKVIANSLKSEKVVLGL